MQTKTEEEKPDFVKVILELRSDSSLDPETKLIQMLNRLTKMDIPNEISLPELFLDPYRNILTRLAAPTWNLATKAKKREMEDLFALF